MTKIEYTGPDFTMRPKGGADDTSQAFVEWAREVETPSGQGCFVSDIKSPEPLQLGFVHAISRWPSVYPNVHHEPGVGKTH